MILAKQCLRFYIKIAFTGSVTFLENEVGFEKMQVTAKMVTVALDLYFKSISLKKIVDHLDQFYERHCIIQLFFFGRENTAILSASMLNR